MMSFTIGSAGNWTEKRSRTLVKVCHCSWAHTVPTDSSETMSSEIALVLTSCAPSATPWCVAGTVDMMLVSDGHLSPGASKSAEYRHPFRTLSICQRTVHGPV